MKATCWLAGAPYSSALLYKSRSTCVMRLVMCCVKYLRPTNLFGVSYAGWDRFWGW